MRGASFARIHASSVFISIWAYPTRVDTLLMFHWNLTDDKKREREKTARDKTAHPSRVWWSSFFFFLSEKLLDKSKCQEGGHKISAAVVEIWFEGVHDVIRQNHSTISKGAWWWSTGFLKIYISDFHPAKEKKMGKRAQSVQQQTDTDCNVKPRYLQSILDGLYRQVTPFKKTKKTSPI